MAESMIEVWTPEKGMRTLTEKELIEEFGEEELPSHKWESAPELPPFLGATSPPGPSSDSPPRTKRRSPPSSPTT